jgi:hypothetical protein
MSWLSSLKVPCAPLNKKLAPILVTCLLASNLVVTAQVTLLGTGAAGKAAQGGSLALSADGNTVLEGGANDNNSAGAAWVFTHSSAGWAQQGNKLVGSGAIGVAGQGASLAISGDGNTALIGGPNDNAGAGAVWVFTRGNGAWMQQGNKLVGTAATGAAGQGRSVALSWDGNTALIGGDGDNNKAGAVWLFTRSNGVWTQQGSKVVGAGATGNAGQGHSVSISWDGNTALEGGFTDNSNAGAAWVFTRNNGVWIQQGGKLVGTGASGATDQGLSVSLSADGNTALVGGSNTAGPSGVWAFTRTGGVWAQQGGLLPAPASSTAQGSAVALSGDGNTAAACGVGLPGFKPQTFAYTRADGVWAFQRVIGGGQTVALSYSGATAVVGSDIDNALTGDVFVTAEPMFAAASTPQSIPIATTNPGGPVFEAAVQDLAGGYLSGATVAFSAPPAFMTLSANGVTDATGRAGVLPTSTTSLAGSYYITATTPNYFGNVVFSVSNVNTNAATGPCKVTSDGDDNGPGTLRYQAAACGLDGTITFDPSITKVTLGQGQDIRLTQDLTIDGGTGVVIDANHQSRAFFITGGTINLNNLTIVNGLARGGNGGSGNDGGGGAAGMGGAIFINNALAVRISNVTFTGNQAKGGNGGTFNGATLAGGGGGVGGDGDNGTATQIGNNGNAGDFGGDGGGQISSFGGGARGTSGFAGFSGGASGFHSPCEEVTTLCVYFGGLGGTAGGGGGGLGGAIFVNSGVVVFNGATFNSNSATQGRAGGSDAENGQGKGGALLVNTEGRAFYVNSPPVFTANSATDAGINHPCFGVGAADNADVCGVLAPAGPPIQQSFPGGVPDATTWTVVNAPYGSFLNGAEASLFVPAGSNHDAAAGGVNNSTRFVQALGNPAADLYVETKFDSIPTLQSQTEGFLVEQDAANYLTFQFGFIGNSVVVSARKVLGHVETDAFSSPISVPSGTASLWMRLQRAGSTWTVTWSSDGATYHSGGSFTQALAASDIGLFAGNYNANAASAPAFDALIAYFFNVGATPPGVPLTDNFNSAGLNTSLWTFVHPAGGSNSVNGSELLLSVPGGSNHDPIFGRADNAVRVMQNISVSNVNFGVEVKFDSIPAQQYQFEGILVEQDPITNYLRLQFGSTGSSLVVSADKVAGGTATGVFSSNISVPAGTKSLWLRVQRSGSTWTVTWSPDGVAYHTGGSFVQDLAVTAIGPFAGNYNVNPAAAPAFTAVIDYFANIATSAAGPPIPDNFNALALNTSLWTLENPVGNGAESVDGSELLLSVPAGSNHDPIFGNTDNSVRVVQAISNADFKVEVQFNSIPTLQYQFEGILVEQDAGNYLRLQLGSTGSALVVSADKVVSGTATGIFSSNLSVPAAPVVLWLRVQKAGSTWTVTWSSDGVTYHTGGSFTQALTVADIGPFVGNYNSPASAAPAFTAKVDYFTTVQ